MARPDPHDHDAALERELAELKRQYDALREDKVRSEQTLSHLEGELSALSDRARELYGTADPEALARMLESMRAENQRLVEDYRAHLSSIRQGLDALETARGDEA